MSLISTGGGKEGGFDENRCFKTAYLQQGASWLPSQDKRDENPHQDLEQYIDQVLDSLDVWLVIISLVIKTLGESY